VGRLWFVFKVAALAAAAEGIGQCVAESEEDYRVLSTQALNGIDRQIVTSTRGVAQRVFRGNLFRLWDGSCAVTGVREALVLRAGHIKPWAVAVTQEKIDPFNGLLLVPNLDALFNEGLISFREDGSVMVSNRWDREDQRRMHVTPGLHRRHVFPESQPYLEYHRQVRFRG
jgi:predicted restriction endonuclease